MQELKDLLDGFKWRERREWQKIAQLASWITAPHLKRPITPDKLLKEKGKKKTTQEESRNNVVELSERMGKGLKIVG